MILAHVVSADVVRDRNHSSRFSPNRAPAYYITFYEVQIEETSDDGRYLVREILVLLQAKSQSSIWLFS